MPKDIIHIYTLQSYGSGTDKSLELNNSNYFSNIGISPF